MSTESLVGRHLARTAKAIGRALDQALADTGGSLPTYLILLTLKTEQVANQRELADSVGIQGATLTHHLNGMEADGLLTRRRDPHNRRVHVVELTEGGEALYERLSDVSMAFDQRLRTGVSDDDVQVLEQLLGRLYDNATRTGP
jgi:MarR family transcriptional regulator for hemolysin